MKNIIIIPARMQSSRLPGKPLLEAGGKTLLQWTYQKATQTIADEVWIATPDQEIMRYCSEHEIYAIHTEKNLSTGTHRCAAAINAYERMSTRLLNVRSVVNLQVDEPLVSFIDLNHLLSYERWPISTLISSSTYLNQTPNGDDVKVAASRGYCHWFSREPIKSALYYHVGVYLYSAKCLRELGKLKVSTCSELESLEQLSWIEHGYRIRSVHTEIAPLPINTEYDFERFRKIVENEPTNITN